MIIWALILIPILGGITAFFPLPDRFRRILLVGVAIIHFVLVLCMGQMNQPITAMGGWMAVDAASLLFLGISSGLFLAASLYAAAYLDHSFKEPVRDYLEGFAFGNRAEGVLIGCLLLFLASMSMVTMAHHLGLLWVSVEATTLTSAPLIYYHRHHRSLEAAWKYLLICSVGIALALLGNFFLAVAISADPSLDIHLLIPELIKHASGFSPVWLKAAFLLMLVGYGTKMGLAPMHTWLPDAHSEAPSFVSALLSGALLNCAFLAILRMQSILVAAGMGDLGREMLLIFGLVSMVWATLLMITQADYKRLLAYSSVEHMGVMAVGIGVSGGAIAGAMFHALNHSLTKAALFLIAGNILAVYHSKNVKDIRGLLQSLPFSGVLWLAGILAIIGFPPFGLFTSELIILKGILEGKHWIVASSYLIALVIAFGAILWVVLQMVYGQSANTDKLPKQNQSGIMNTIIPAILIGCTLILGLWVPLPLWRLICSAAALWEGGL